MHTVASAIEYDDSTPESNAIRCRTDHISRHWHIRLSIIFTHRQLSVVGARCTTHSAQHTHEHSLAVSQPCHACLTRATINLGMLCLNQCDSRQYRTKITTSHTHSSVFEYTHKVENEFLFLCFFCLFRWSCRSSRWETETNIIFIY